MDPRTAETTTATFGGRCVQLRTSSRPRRSAVLAEDLLHVVRKYNGVKVRLSDFGQATDPWLEIRTVYGWVLGSAPLIRPLIRNVFPFWERAGYISVSDAINAPAPVQNHHAPKRPSIAPGWRSALAALLRKMADKIEKPAC